MVVEQEGHQIQRQVECRGVVASEDLKVESLKCYVHLRVGNWPNALDGVVTGDMSWGEKKGRFDDVMD